MDTLSKVVTNVYVEDGFIRFSHIREPLLTNSSYDFSSLLANHVFVNFGHGIYSHRPLSSRLALADRQVNLALVLPSLSRV
jgi:hypothetical protein